MNLLKQINNDIRNAIKEKNNDKKLALRSLKSAIIIEDTKDPNSSISDENIIVIIAKLVKQRKDSAEIYYQQNRSDLAKEEINQSTYLECYLPKQLTEKEIEEVVRETILQTGSTTHSDIGKCMPILIQKLKGRADGGLISKILRNQLQ